HEVPAFHVLLLNRVDWEIVAPGWLLRHRPPVGRDGDVLGERIRVGHARSSYPATSANGSVALAPPGGGVEPPGNTLNMRERSRGASSIAAVTSTNGCREATLRGTIIDTRVEMTCAPN